MKKSYSDLLKDPRWQKKRLEIMKRDKFKCKLCGDEGTTLQVHHKEYISGNKPWEYGNQLLVTLCEHCHMEVEDLKLDCPDFCISDIKIIKSKDWTGDRRITYIILPDNNRTLRIYNGKELIQGLNFKRQGELAKIFR